MALMPAALQGLPLAYGKENAATTSEAQPQSSSNGSLAVSFASLTKWL